MPTLDEIETAIIGRVEDSLRSAASSLAVQRGFSGLVQPAVYVAIDAGTLTRVTSTTFRQQVSAYVTIVFKELSSEAQRRKGLYAILAGVLQCLLLQTLELDMAPLEPRAWKNVTTADLAEKGLLAFEIELATHFTLVRADDEATVDLLRVGLEYYLQDPADDEAVDASDLVALGE